MKLWHYFVAILAIAAHLSTAQDDDDDDDEFGSVQMDASDPSTVAWQDTEMTTNIWRICSSGALDSLKELVNRDPSVIHMRSGDGRGALWWASEYGHEEMVKYLIANGANPTLRDKQGLLPAQVPHSEPPKFDSPPGSFDVYTLLLLFQLIYVVVLLSFVLFYSSL